MSCNISDIVADETLFQEIQRGDEKAFDVLFLKYYPSLCAYAQRFVEYDDGQEIVQDVMVWLWENRRNEIKQKIINTLYDNQQLEYEDPDFYIVEELSRKIEEALQRLPDSYREAFELNRFQHMTYGEIATCLEVSSKTVDYRIQQALKLLRVELKDYLPILLAIL